MPLSRLSDTTTEGVRIAARPFYMPQQSNPDLGQYVFGYRIVIHNESLEPVQLMSRQWLIIDAEGGRKDVRGPGVVGEQPVIEPGQGYQYTSYCPLPTEWGTMEGSYQMRRERDGSVFDAVIGRFYLTMESQYGKAESKKQKAEN